MTPIFFKLGLAVSALFLAMYELNIAYGTVRDVYHLWNTSRTGSDDK